MRVGGGCGRVRGSGEGWARAFFPHAIPFITLHTALHYNHINIYITRPRPLPHASCALHDLLCLPLRPQKAVKHTRPTEPAYLITLDARLALCAEKSAAEPLHPKPRTSLSTMAVSSSLQRLHLPLQQARWRRDRLLVHQLRLAAASWAARRQPPSVANQIYQPKTDSGVPKASVHCPGKCQERCAHPSEPELPPQPAVGPSVVAWHARAVAATMGQCVAAVLLCVEERRRIDCMHPAIGRSCRLQSPGDRCGSSCASMPESTTRICC